MAAAGCGVAAVLLLRTRVPRLDLPRLEAGDLFPAAELARSERFRAVERWLWVASTAAELAVLGLLAWKARSLAARLRRPWRGRVRTGGLLALLAAVAVWLATLPAAAAAHWWERRYGLSTQGYGAWLGDQAISLAVLATLVCLACAGGLALAGWLGRRWWIAGAAGLTALGVLFALGQPVVVQPLFNRFDPLRDPALVAQIGALAQRLDVKLGGIEVADASRRTTAPNAEVVGMGPTRRVVLDDTLLDGRFGRGEILAVAAHELAHVARHHVWKGVAWFALFAVPCLALIAWALERRGGAQDPALVPFALLSAFALFLATLPAQNAISRRYEAEADWLALVATRDPASAVALERSFARAALIDPSPPVWGRILLATHPTPLQRIEMALAFQARAGA